MREIGVRAALGASRRDILALILREGMTLSGIGVVIGLGGAVAASQAIISMLYGISRFDSGNSPFPAACQESKMRNLAILAGSLV